MTFSQFALLTIIFSAVHLWRTIELVSWCGHVWLPKEPVLLYLLMMGLLTEETGWMFRCLELGLNRIKIVFYRARHPKKTSSKWGQLLWKYGRASPEKKLFKFISLSVLCLYWGCVQSHNNDIITCFTVQTLKYYSLTTNYFGATNIWHERLTVTYKWKKSRRMLVCSNVDTTTYLLITALFRSRIKLNWQIIVAISTKMCNWVNAPSLTLECSNFPDLTLSCLTRII